MASVHKTGRLRRPVAPPTPTEALFGAFFSKDFALPDPAAPVADLAVTAASDTDRLLKQSHDLLSRLRQAIEDRNGLE